MKNPASKEMVVIRIKACNEKFSINPIRNVITSTARGVYLLRLAVK